MRTLHFDKNRDGVIKEYHSGKVKVIDNKITSPLQNSNSLRDEVYRFIVGKIYATHRDMEERFDYGHRYGFVSKLTFEESLEIAGALDDLHLSGNIIYNYSPGGDWSYADPRTGYCICAFHNKRHIMYEW